MKTPPSSDSQAAWFEVYGTPDRRIRGSCIVPTRVGNLEGRFECVQLSNARMYLRVEPPRLPRMGAMVLGHGTFEPTGEILGDTDRGYPFRAEAFGTANIQMRFPGRPLVVDYILTEVIIGDREVI